MKTKPIFMIISACTARKQDSISIPQGAKIVQPKDCLNDKVLIEKFVKTRKTILADPKAKVGTKSTYAFDLYVNTGNAYKSVGKTCENIHPIRRQGTPFLGKPLKN